MEGRKKDKKALDSSNGMIRLNEDSVLYKGFELMSEIRTGKRTKPVAESEEGVLAVLFVDKQINTVVIIQLILLFVLNISILIRFHFDVCKT